MKCPNCGSLNLTVEREYIKTYKNKPSKRVRIWRCRRKLGIAQIECNTYIREYI